MILDTTWLCKQNHVVLNCCPWSSHSQRFYPLPFSRLKPLEGTRPWESRSQVALIRLQSADSIVATLEATNVGATLIHSPETILKRVKAQMWCLNLLMMRSKLVIQKLEASLAQAISNRLLAVVIGWVKNKSWWWTVTRPNCPILRNIQRLIRVKSWVNLKITGQRSKINVIDLAKVSISQWFPQILTWI